MKTYIIFDSLYGNTRKVAQVINSAIVKDAEILSAKETRFSDLKDIGLLIVGSPTHAGRATANIQRFLKSIPRGALKNIKVTSFDTRISLKEQPVWICFIINLIGYAAWRITKVLQRREGNLIVDPEGFVVMDKEGPLRRLELERAFKWGQKISSIINK